MSTKDTNPKDLIGCKKPPLSTVPMPVIFEVGAALLEGACKYGRHNYRIVGVRSSVYFDATMRHLSQWWEGEDIDKDSGINHISKAIASLVVLRDAMMQGKVNDDRPPKANEEWMWEAQNQTDEVLKRYPEPKKPYVQKDAVTQLQGMARCLPQKAAPTNTDLALERMAKEDLYADMTHLPKSTECMQIALRSLNVGSRFRTVTGPEGLFRVTRHKSDTDEVFAELTDPDAEYYERDWSFPGSLQVQFPINEDKS